MTRVEEILLILFHKEFDNLREQYKTDVCVFDERFGKEQAVEDCERIIKKVLTGQEK